MKFADFLINTKQFLIKRITELFGILIVLSGAIILLSLITYSPDDPNFIIGKNNDVKNILGYKGSVVSDFLFQSIGMIAFLLPFTLFFFWSKYIY